MNIHTDISLKNYTTMRLGGRTRFMAEIHNPSELPEIYKNAQAQNLPIFILGGGSNVIANDEDFNGLVLRNRIQGFEVLHEDTSSLTIKLGAGENWDDVVRRSVEMNLSGIEAMSAIPGTVGGCPVQNVGAYGQEIADTLQSLEVYDSKTSNFKSLEASQCHFSYRDSIFRGPEMGRYFITSVTLRLNKTSLQPPFYPALQKYFDDNNVTIYTPATIREAVTKIRAEKLPNPKERPNTGSFFKNAIVEDWQLKSLMEEYPDVPHFNMPDGRHKVPTGWLIDKCELRGSLISGMRVNDKNALVLINESASSYQDLANARDQIIRAVRDKFRIEISQEPLEI